LDPIRQTCPHQSAKKLVSLKFLVFQNILLPYTQTYEEEKKYGIIVGFDCQFF